MARAVASRWTHAHQFRVYFSRSAKRQQSPRWDSPTGETVGSPTVPAASPNSPSRGTQQSHGESDLPAKSKASARNGSLNGRREREKNKTRAHARARQRSSPDDASLNLRGGSAAETSKPQAKPNQGAELDEAFEKFWRVYPKRVAKEAARKAFMAAIKRGVDPEVMIAGAKAYAVERSGQDPKYTKHPATWLNGGCWNDEVSGTVIDQEGNVVAVEQPPPHRGDGQKTWKEIGDEYLAEVGDGPVH